MGKFGRALLSLFLVCVLAAGAIVAAAGLWFRNAVSVDRSLPRKTTQLVVPKGSTFSEIAGLLAGAGVIDNVFAFRLLGRLRHAAADVHAGEFRFPAHQTQSEILSQLQTGGAQIATWVTIPEGYTSREIAQRLAEDGFGPAEALLNVFQHDSIVVGGVKTPNLEGYLFPSTYLIPSGSGPQAIAKIMTDEFQRQLPADAAARARSLHVSVPQAITLASLVEREAKIDSERPLMAGVYYNRLRFRMPLEVDATIEYIFPEHKTAITNADLAIESPYNTYKRLGLPPTPIASPGRPSILAAFHPQPSQYLYYISKSDGHSVFAKTLQQHNANVARYLK